MGRAVRVSILGESVLMEGIVVSLQNNTQIKVQHIDAEEKDAFEKRFIQLGGMAQSAAGRLREVHAYGAGGYSAVKLAIDEVGDTPEQQAERRHHRGQPPRPRGRRCFVADTALCDLRGLCV